MRSLVLLFVMMSSVPALAQMPPIEPGVSQELARWRSVRYSNVRYKLNLTLEKMSPVLKGSMEIRLQYAAEACDECPPRYIVLDWRKIRGHEEKSTISNVTLNGLALSPGFSRPESEATPPKGGTQYKYSEHNEHLIFSDGVVMGENVITLNFTSPILPSGSAITRYVDKEDGSEYLYSLFVPSDASTAFPVFDQPDIKARFSLSVASPANWNVISNSPLADKRRVHLKALARHPHNRISDPTWTDVFAETKPISTYVFAFAAGPFEKFDPAGLEAGLPAKNAGVDGRASPPLNGGDGSIYVRKSQAAKFKPHAAEVFRLNREAVRYFEEYFNYKFPWPKYDLVLIPEFPFGGMEHAGATFLRESSIIFPQEPTRNDHMSRALLMFHEASHQWFGDTVTMRWFDDLWLKEGFATFTAYKAMEKIMPEMLAWKVFYERVKQAAYQTDSTRGTTAIYQPIANLSAAKSAYGNIVYNKAPAFLRQAEFYLGEEKFQTAVRAFLKKHEFENAGWEDLVKEFEIASVRDLKEWADAWVKQRGLSEYRIKIIADAEFGGLTSTRSQRNLLNEGTLWSQKTNLFIARGDNSTETKNLEFFANKAGLLGGLKQRDKFVFANYGDYGYGIFLLDEKSREYVLKNIQNEKDPFLRSMMWGALWDSVREGELDPREFVELVVRVLSTGFSRQPPKGGTQYEDESTTALLLNRVGTAMNYYIDAPGGNASVNERGESQAARSPRSLTVASLPERVEEMLIAGMRNSPTQGQRITYYRAFLNIASSENARRVLKQLLTTPSAEAAATPPSKGGESRANVSAGNAKPPAAAGGTIPLKTKDRFDIVTRLLILGDPDAPKLLADLEKTETSDDAKRYAYAAKAGIPTAENKARYWKDFTENKEISESWIEAAFGPWNSIRHSELTLPYLERALKELPNHKRNRKIFFVNGWLAAFIGGQRSEEALAIVNKFLSVNPDLDNDLRLKILENVDVIERAVRIRSKY